MLYLNLNTSFIDGNGDNWELKEILSKSERETNNFTFLLIVIKLL